MEVIPAIDIRDGRCVRLLKGDFGQETVYAADPVDVARDFAASGARRLHLVDLDAARGGGDNRALVERIVAATPIPVQVGGGVRTAFDVAALLAAGATGVVMGTTAVRSPDVLAAIAAEHPGSVLAALDLRLGRAAVEGWLESDGSNLETLIQAWNLAPLGGLICTSVDRDGTLAGPDLVALTRVLALSRHPVTYSGGMGTIDDLLAVAGAGAASVILGRSLYEGTLTLEAAIAAI